MWRHVNVCGRGHFSTSHNRLVCAHTHEEPKMRNTSHVKRTEKNHNTMHLMPKPMPCRICACHSSAEHSTEVIHISHNGIRWNGFPSTTSHAACSASWCQRMSSTQTLTQTHTMCVAHAWSRSLGCAHSTLGAKFNYLQPSGTCALVNKRVDAFALTRSLAHSSGFVYESF